MAEAKDGERREQAPLASRMRPRDLREFLGQEHLLGEGRALRKCLDDDRLPSLVLWGPPGSGKTTLANIIARLSKSGFISVSAVNAGVADLRKAALEAEKRFKFSGQRTILFIDEIHRFNKGQQDAVLPFVENGTVTLIGATTENPSFEVISPLLSRSRVFVLKPLGDTDLKEIILRALADSERGLGGYRAEIEVDALDFLVAMSGGDARVALNALEMAAWATTEGSDGKRSISRPTVEEALQKRALLYDKGGDQHYDLISALHKSLRGSDPDAALYWLGRMLEAGEDPLYIARRLIRFASEDVGMADPMALTVVVSAQQATHFVGMPEANVILAQAVIYLATAPKSNSLYTAYSRVKEEVEKGKNEPVPLHIRNPVTSLMKNLDYGKDYKYGHNYEGHFTEQEYLPPRLSGKRFYFPGELGFEKDVAERLKKWWGEKKK